MVPNVKPSQMYPVLTGANINPASQAAGTVNGAWILLTPDAKWLIVQLLVGAGAGTFTVDVQQATDNAGTGSKALVTAGQLIPAGTNASTDAEVNLDQQLDYANGYAYVRVVLITAGGAGTLASVGVRTGPSAYMS